MPRGGKQYKLSLYVTANTASATSAIKGLENRLSKLATGGGASGGFARIGKTALGGIRRSVGMAGGLLSGLLKTAGFVTSGIAKGFRMAAGVIGGAFKFALRSVKGLLKGVGVAAGAAAASVWGFMKAMKPAGMVQQFRIQLEVLLGTAEKATKRLGYLRKFAASTPFELPQVISGANLMESFGIFSKRAFTAAGDAAATFQKDISQVVRSLSYLAAGRSGEAMESLAQLGVTRKKLSAQFGVEFSSSGELQSSTEQALESVIQYFESNFGGMMKRQSKTLFGSISNLKDAIWNAFAKAGGGLTGPVSNAVRMLSEGAEKMGERVEEYDWTGIGEKIEAGAAGLLGTLKTLMDPAQRKEFIAEMKAGFGETLHWVKMLPAAIASDFGTVLGNFMNEAGRWGGWLVTGLQGVFRFGAALFGQALAGLSGALGDKARLAATPVTMFNRGQVQRTSVGILEKTKRGRQDLAELRKQYPNRLIGGSSTTYDKALKELAAMAVARRQRGALGALGKPGPLADENASWADEGFQLSKNLFSGATNTRDALGLIGKGMAQATKPIRDAGAAELAQQRGFRSAEAMRYAGTNPVTAMAKRGVPTEALSALMDLDRETLGKTLTREGMPTNRKELGELYRLVKAQQQAEKKAQETNQQMRSDMRSMLEEMRDLNTAIAGG